MAAEGKCGTLSARNIVWGIKQLKRMEKHDE
jgi:hypothetical protein